MRGLCWDGKGDVRVDTVPTVRAASRASKSDAAISDSLAAVLAEPFFMIIFSAQRPIQRSRGIVVRRRQTAFANMRVFLQNSARSLGRGFFVPANKQFSIFFNLRERLRPYLTYVK